MKRVLVLVEGQTEEVFANELLAPHLLLFDVHLAPVVVATKRPAGAPKEAGGISSWTQVRREVQLLLADSSLDCVTTMIDYYGLPADWPGWAGRPSGGAAAVAHLEASMATDLGDDRFLPYLALHEAEAMVFAGPAEAAAVSGMPGLADRVRRIAIEHGGLEGVNDNPNTAPSKRLLRLWPTYVKTSDGPAILRRIGLQSIRNECPHLHRWLTALEQM